MPEFYSWAILLINHQDEIGEKQLSVFGSRGGQNSPLMHVPLSITKSISKIFKPNFVCLLTNERYKTYQTGFSFGRLGHAPGVGLGATVGVWGSVFFPEIQPDLVCGLLT